MCGIAGYFGTAPENTLTQMMNSLIHRGPDDSGTWRAGDLPLFLGHRRLSILDIGGGHQPMIDSNTGNVIVFNGEIYNHGELRKTLQNLGHTFETSHSDTETLLKAYAQWGETMVTHLNGMWAFIIYDPRRKILFGSRDRFGEKPFFYAFDQHQFVFASELTAIEKYTPLSLTTDHKSIQKYFAYGYIPEPRTIYRQVFKLPHGSNIIYDLQRKSVQVLHYWEFHLEPEGTFSKSKVNRLAEELRSHLDEAVRMRLISDAPLGVFLSGGVDSSAIAYFAQKHLNGKLNTFSIGFTDPSFDESKYARMVSELLRTRHFEKIFDISVAREILPDVINRLDEPLADASILPTFLLAQFAHQQTKVALSGDAGDELFAGYDPFKAIGVARKYTQVVPRGMRPLFKSIARNLVPLRHGNMSFGFRINRLLGGLDHPEKFWMPTWMAPFDRDAIQSIMNAPVEMEDLYSEAISIWNRNSSLSLVDKGLEFYTRLYLVNDILVKSDRAGMMASLETRSVFTDIHLVNFVRKLPWQYKLNQGTTKYLLKKALEPLLPHSILYRKKKGFGIPIGLWFKEGKLPIPKSKNLGLSPEMISNRLIAHQKNHSDHRLMLWSYLVLTHWENHRKGFAH